MSGAFGVHASGVVKRFGSTIVLDGVDVAFEPRAVTAVTGANGAGKTTLLKVFATLLRPDAGEARVCGHDVLTEPAGVRSSIGVALVNERALYWRLSGRKNLAFFARMRGLAAPVAAARVAEIASILGLSEILDRRVASWSAGQRQRLVLARAVLPDPPVLLIDEPMRGLDAEGIERVRDLLRSRARSGATVLVAAPAIEEFRDLCDAIVTLDRGRVVASGDRASVSR